MKEQSAFEKRVQSIYEKYAGLSLQGKIDVIAQTFGCKTGEIRTFPLYRQMAWHQRYVHPL